MGKRITWKKGKIHPRTMKNGKKQKGRWEYPNGAKKGRRWKRMK